MIVEATVGGEAGDIAIDDISLFSGPCPASGTKRKTKTEHLAHALSPDTSLVFRCIDGSFFKQLIISLFGRKDVKHEQKS